MRNRRTPGNPRAASGHAAVNIKGFRLPKTMKALTGVLTMRGTNVQEQIVNAGYQECTQLFTYVWGSGPQVESSATIDGFAAERMFQIYISQNPPVGMLSGNSSQKLYLQSIRTKYKIKNQSPSAAHCVLYWCKPKFDLGTSTDTPKYWWTNNAEATTLSKTGNAYSPSQAGALPFDVYSFTSRFTVVKSSRFVIQPGEESHQDMTQRVNRILNQAQWDGIAYSRTMSIFPMLVTRGDLTMSALPLTPPYTTIDHLYAALRMGIVCETEYKLRVFQQNLHSVDYNEDMAQVFFPGPINTQNMNPETQTYNNLKPL